MTDEVTATTPAAEKLDRVVAAVDGLVPVATSVDNAVLPDHAPGVRWAGALFAVCAGVLVPWTVVLAVTLPEQAVAVNYDLSWVGFDVLLLTAVAATAVAALRRSRFLGLVASASAALLVVDAWFDVVTSPAGPDRITAGVMAVLVELPLAGVCCWLALHAADIAEKRLVLLLRLHGGSVAGGLHRLGERRAAFRRRRP
jgi:hypothetical protein